MKSRVAIVIGAIKHRGVVFTGLRHGFIIKDLVDCGFLTEKGSIKDSEQGFVDSENVFHTREAAWAIAFKSGQITKDHGTLYTEDLW